MNETILCILGLVPSLPEVLRVNPHRAELQWILPADLRRLNLQLIIVAGKRIIFYNTHLHSCGNLHSGNECAADFQIHHTLILLGIHH